MASTTKVAPSKSTSQTGAAKKRKRAKPASAAAPGGIPLESIPITHHDVTMALSKGEAALDLLKLAEEHYEGDSLEWMRMICIDVVGEELDRAKGAYEKAVGDGKAARS
jgi:hypothetical protein